MKHNPRMRVGHPISRNMNFLHGHHNHRQSDWLITDQIQMGKQFAHQMQSETFRPMLTIVPATIYRGPKKNICGTTFSSGSFGSCGKAVVFHMI